MQMNRKKVLVIVGVVVFIILALLIFWIGFKVDDVQRQEIITHYIKANMTLLYKKG